MNEQKEEKMPERRKFLLNTMRSLGIATVVGVVWSGLISPAPEASLILRPPAALPEKDFLAKCIKCGLCVEACPFGALRLVRPGEAKPIGTPYFIPREKPCYMCKDIPCLTSCPTAALDKGLVSEAGTERPDINLARIGLAVIDRETCIAYSGIQCDACYRSCPRIDKALTVEYSRNSRTGKHALLLPVVHSDSCTGCGLCERACVTEKASIFVLPRRIVMGEASSRYVKGWDSRDEERILETPEDETTKTPRSEKDPLDYLNKGDL